MSAAKKIVPLPSGEKAYTRDGAFKQNAEGKLVNSDGYPLASEVTIPPDAQSINVGADGTVSAWGANADGQFAFQPTVSVDVAISARKTVSIIFSMASSKF